MQLVAFVVRCTVDTNMRRRNWHKGSLSAINIDLLHQVCLAKYLDGKYFEFRMHYFRVVRGYGVVIDHHKK